MIGRTLSHYRIVDEIGRGGMGVVYRARDLRLDREVALKVLTPEQLQDAELRRRFLQEARTAGALQHPSIAVVHEIDEVEGIAFMAMELVQGRKLADLVGGEDLDLHGRLELALEVAEGLAEAHEKGVIHRDLKPANILVTASGHAKIIDFGLAKLLDPLGVLGDGVKTPPQGGTDPGRILGTAAYMSPEQARGERIDARSDIFSFGSVLCEMLTGHAAFRGDNAIETLHAVLKEPARRLPPLGSEPLRRHVQKILDRCLEKDPEDRYPDMKGVLTDLRAARRSLDAPVEDTAAGAERTRSSVSRLRVVIVDDEELARAVLREYLAAHPEIEIVAECANGFEAVKAVAEKGPDLLFLDIQMPKLTGFEVLELIEGDVGIIFVTAFDEFALKAFEVHAVDYLLKPYSAQRLSDALARARERLERSERLPVGDLASSVRRGPLERLLVRQGGRVHVIPVGKLDYAEAQDDYVSLKSEGKAYLKEQTLMQLEAALDPARFVRIHRSYILNIDRIARLEAYAKDSRQAILTDGTRLPVSRAGYARLKALL